MQPQPTPQPTQTRHPWRATVRTVFVVVLAVIPLVPMLVEQLGLSGYGWAAGAVAVAGALTRIMAIPAVNAVITEYLPALAPTPRQP